MYRPNQNIPKPVFRILEEYRQQTSHLESWSINTSEAVINLYSKPYLSLLELQ